MLKSIKTYFQKIIKLGVNPNSLALSISLCLLFTTLPIYGLNTLILNILAVNLKLNLPLTLVISYSMEPLRFLLFIPFIQISENILGLEQSTITLEEISYIFDHNILMKLRLLGVLFLKSIIGWTLVIIPSSLLIYYASSYLFEKIYGNKRIFIGF